MKLGASRFHGWYCMSPAVQETRETQVHSLGWEDLLEDEMATHSGILAWEISWIEEPAGCSLRDSKYLDTS